MRGWTEMHCKFCGIDSSTKRTAIALFVDGQYQDCILIAKDKMTDVYERMNSMIGDIIAVLDEWQPDVIWQEHPQGHGNNVDMVGKLCEIVGCVRTWAVMHGADFQEINPSQWRKYVGIQQGKKTRAELKQASMEFIKEKLGIDRGDDVSDAISIGYAVMNYMEKLS